MKTGTCSNRAGCALAYAGSQIRFDESPVCPECGQQLTVTERAVWRRDYLGLGLAQLVVILTYIENLLVGARSLPYPVAPVAIDLSNVYIVVEAVLFLLLVAFLFFRYLKLPKDWISWYTAGALFVFAGFQLAVFVAFEGATVLSATQPFFVLRWLITYAALPLLVINLIGLLRVCLGKPGWNTVIASVSSVTCGLFLAVLSGVIGVYRFSFSSDWPTQFWIASWSTVFFALAWVAPLRFVFVTARGGSSVEDPAKTAGAIVRPGNRGITVTIAVIQIVCAVLVVLVAA